MAGNLQAVELSVGTDVIEGFKGMREGLTSLRSLVGTVLDLKWVEYEIQGGIAKGLKLWCEKRVAVHLLRMPATTAFNPHGHLTPDRGICTEFVIWFTGKTKILWSAQDEIEERVCCAGDHMVFPSGVKHMGYNLIATEVISISVPAADGCSE